MIGNEMSYADDAPSFPSDTPRPRVFRVNIIIGGNLASEIADSVITISITLDLPTEEDITDSLYDMIISKRLQCCRSFLFFSLHSGKNKVVRQVTNIVCEHVKI